MAGSPKGVQWDGIAWCGVIVVDCDGRGGSSGFNSSFQLCSTRMIHSVCTICSASSRFVAIGVVKGLEMGGGLILRGRVKW